MYRTQTDLVAIKNIAKMLNHIMPVPNNVLFIDHPFLTITEWKYDFENKKHLTNELGLPQFFNLFDPKDIELAMQQKDKFIDKADNYSRILMLLNKRYFTAFFSFTYMYLSDDEFCDNLLYIFTGTEYPNADKNISPNKWKSLFKRADKHKLMDEQDLKHYYHFIKSLSNV